MATIIHERFQADPNSTLAHWTSCSSCSEHLVTLATHANPSVALTFTRFLAWIVFPAAAAADCSRSRPTSRAPSTAGSPEDAPLAAPLAHAVQRVAALTAQLAARRKPRRHAVARAEEVLALLAAVSCSWVRSLSVTSEVSCMLDTMAEHQVRVPAAFISLALGIGATDPLERALTADNLDSSTVLHAMLELYNASPPSTKRAILQLPNAPALAYRAVAYLSSPSPIAGPVTPLLDAFTSHYFLEHHTIETLCDMVELPDDPLPVTATVARLMRNYLFVLADSGVRGPINEARIVRILARHDGIVILRQFFLLPRAIVRLRDLLHADAEPAVQLSLELLEAYIFEAHGEPRLSDLGRAVRRHADVLAADVEEAVHAHASQAPESAVRAHASQTPELADNALWQRVREHQRELSILALQVRLADHSRRGSHAPPASPRPPTTPRPQTATGFRGRRRITQS